MRQNRGLQKETTSVETKKQNQPLSAEYIIQKSKGYYKNWLFCRLNSFGFVGTVQGFIPQSSASANVSLSYPSVAPFFKNHPLPRRLGKPKQSGITFWIIINLRKDCLTGLHRFARNDAGGGQTGLLCLQWRGREIDWTTLLRSQWRRRRIDRILRPSS